MATTITVLKKPAQEGGFTTVSSDSPIQTTPNKIFAATSEMQFANDGQTQLTVYNRGVVPTVITFQPNDTEIDGVAFAAIDQDFEIPEDSLVIFGPFSRKAYNRAPGNVLFTVSQLTDVYLWARSNQR